ncbi:ABC transporter permease [Clostridiaceae bacterium M8S5]|nr:ABC transporter permease [Clostridiaceae bacterium M8S5]
MLRYIIKRTSIAILTLWVIITITFILMNSIPGDPFTSEKKIDPEILKLMKQKYGLDKPLIQQYGIYLKNLLKGDLGHSLKYKTRTVNEMLLDGFKNSSRLGVLALSLGLLVGITFGIIAGINRGRFFDFFVILIAIVGVSVPNFVYSALFQYFFAVKIRLFPVARWGTKMHYVLPVLALGSRYIASIARMMRTSMLDVLGQDYIKTAKAKGLSKFVVITKHAIRNAILPIITMVGVYLAGILVGSFIVEKVFAVPGMGKYLIMAIKQNDYTVIMGTTIFYAAILVFMMLVIDILYGLIDPRIKLD